MESFFSIFVAYIQEFIFGLALLAAVGVVAYGFCSAGKDVR